MLLLLLFIWWASFPICAPSIQLEAIYSSPVSIVHRADLIVVMFDAHKLDISDELKIVIDALRPHHDKMRYNTLFSLSYHHQGLVFGKKANSIGKTYLRSTVRPRDTECC